MFIVEFDYGNSVELIEFDTLNDAQEFYNTRTNWDGIRLYEYTPVLSSIDPDELKLTNVSVI